MMIFLLANSLACVATTTFLNINDKRKVCSVYFIWPFLKKYFFNWVDYLRKVITKKSHESSGLCTVYKCLNLHLGVHIFIRCVLISFSFFPRVAY